MTSTKTAVVTGANSGIGLESARGLAARGYRVLMLCRSAERADKAKADIDGSLPDGAEGSTEIVLCDLGLQSDVRRAAADIADRVAHLGLLLNNAGMTIRRREETAEGIDAMLAVNHLGPFLLTNLLRPLLEGSAPARVVNVASEAHRFTRKLHLDNLQARGGYGLMGFPRYCETKLMNILFTRELARRLDGTGVTANAVHPGTVSTNLGSPPAVLRPLFGLFFRSAADGAKTSLTAATDPTYADRTGSYFINSKPADHKLSKAARDEAAGRDLWAQSAALVGLG